MHIGGSLALIALGAILAFAVADSIDGVALGTIGIILMVCGVLGLLITLFLMRDRGDRTVVRDREPF